MTSRFAFAAALIAAVLVPSAGCGPGCQDACEVSLPCRAQLEGRPAPTQAEIGACADACDRDPVCADKDAAIACLAAIRCDDPQVAEVLASCDRLCCEGPDCPVQ